MYTYKFILVAYCWGFLFRVFEMVSNLMIYLKEYYNFNDLRTVIILFLYYDKIL